MSLDLQIIAGLYPETHILETYMRASTTDHSVNPKDLLNQSSRTKKQLAALCGAKATVSGNIARTRDICLLLPGPSFALQDQSMGGALPHPRLCPETFSTNIFCKPSIGPGGRPLRKGADGTKEPLTKFQG